ncbi:hydroxymethylglutaryl-CoA lyase [Peribacillus frigoritolerans]|uniref:hydroxymethylglutaryl-CoA lyase n=1 Tax=Peribacillus frigoritolerans TaxID=450367 RepID=UPI002B24DB61|nr:hydroxymethylglutaryl-CoA lyase [Peribacillus frigoritolerans]MEB2631553.1 hydroxymethylglutaryl-CoA lyase [Peribacillus frigoritolerans]
MMNWPEKVTIKEVGPRDGLQNEKVIIPAQSKMEWIDQLSDTGLSYIEVTSFVHPKWIPQLSDAALVAKGIKRKPGITYAALVPNQRGLESALEANIDDISVFMSSSETHNLKNINKSISDTFPILKDVIRTAANSGKTVRGYVSTVFGCPYEGEVSTDQVFRVCDQLFEYGIGEVSLGDTIGVASPRQVALFLEQAVKRYDMSQIALHFHDTRGMALANILESLNYGIDTFDSSLGGLGGCPYAPGASGNVATDDLVHMLHKMGIHTGINPEKLMKAAAMVQSFLEKPLPSHQMAVNNAQ